MTDQGPRDRGPISSRQVVLVVEDEPLLRMMAVDLVEDAGFEAVEAADATEAVRILEARTDIRIMFTDIDMPRGIDGLMLAALVRRRWPPIEIIVTSGFRTFNDIDLPVRSEFFSKPYDRAKVTAAMKRMAH
ncbi:response regulator [Chenggangzhangella methanolivorans]|uniref:Response regulator n=2 Tax=Chenggangzhangella methanolivorans TaxID=1437009 RepID=A0A9E6UP15_9HYPH|nr:response regulator [Chenggangzhangella methanolivorans]